MFFSLTWVSYGQHIVGSCFCFLFSKPIIPISLFWVESSHDCCRLYLCKVWSWGVNKLFSDLFWACVIFWTWEMTIFSYILCLLLNILVFNVWHPKKKKRKTDGEKFIKLLHPLEFTSAREERVCNNGRRYKNSSSSSFSSCLCLEAAIRAQISNIWRTGSFCALCAICSRNMYTAACQGPERWARVAATVLRAEIDQS